MLPYTIRSRPPSSDASNNVCWLSRATVPDNRPLNSLPCSGIDSWPVRRTPSNPKGAGRNSIVAPSPE